MTERMIESHNRVVGDNDLVYLVGDLCLGGGDDIRTYLGRLNGKKILIKGNHDRVKNHAEAVTLGYEAMYDKLVIELEGLRIGLSHYPFRNPKEMPSKYELRRPECDFLVHGHVHDLWATKVDEASAKLMINVSVEPLDYKPISLKEILLLYRSHCEK